MKNIFLNEFVLAAGIGFILVVVGRLINDEKLRAMGLSHGRFISKHMGGKMGKKSWEKIEAFIQGCGLAYFKGLWDGLDEDDKNKL